MRRGILVVGLVSISALLLWALSGEDTLPRVPDVGEIPSATPEPDRTEPGGSRRIEVANAFGGIGDRPPPSQTLSAHAVLVQLRGRVVDAFSSRPLAGAEVALSAGDGRAVAADDGSYALEFPLVDQLVAVECTHPGYLTARRVVWNRRVPKGGRVDQFDFELTPRAKGAVLVGRLVDERGTPVRGARTRLRRTPPTRRGLGPPAPGVERETGSDGRFEFRELLPGKWDLLATAPGLEDHERVGLELPPESRTDLGSIRLARFPWARLTGRVVDGAGSAVPGVIVRVRQIRGSRVATSITDGTFEVARIAPGTWPVGIDFGSDDRHGGLGSLEFGARQTVHREIVLERGPHFVGGQVLLGDTPASDLEVTADVPTRDSNGWTVWTTRTDENGRFRIEGLPADRIDLGFTQERPYASFEAPGVIADRDDHRFAFAAPARPVTVSGVVRDTAGEPIEGATVAPLEPLNDAGRDRTGLDGSYRIEVVLSADMTNLIVAEHAGYLSATKPAARDMASSVGNIALDFTLSPDSDVGTIEGIVTDERGRPLREVECLCRSDGDSGLWRTHSDSLGRFRFDAVSPGAIELHLRHRDHQSLRQAAGQLSPRGHLRLEAELAALQHFTRTVVLRGARGEPLGDVVVDVWRGHHLLAATTDADGRATLRNLPAGLVQLSVEVDGYARHSMTHVVDGPSDRELVFELTRGTSTLEGILVTADGRPRDDAEVIIRQKPVAGVAAIEAITYSNSDGRFRVEGLIDADYEVSVWSSAGAIVRTARPGGVPMRIELPGR